MQILTPFILMDRDLELVVTHVSAGITQIDTLDWAWTTQENIHDMQALHCIFNDSNSDSSLSVGD